MNQDTDAAPPGDLLSKVEHILRDAGDLAQAPGVQVRSSPQPFADFMVFFGKDVADLAGLTARLTARPELGFVKRTGHKLALRLSDEHLAETGRRLEAGARPGLSTADILAGKRYFVDYGDPNATKALHVGHLRCLALGHGVTSVLKAAGASVTTLSLVNDIGRNMCEAMAGCLEQFPDATPESAGMKSDHFVGRAYSAYVASLKAPDAHEGTLDAPLGRELEDRPDLAQSLLDRWAKGDPGVRALWSKVRSWVLDGQDATTRRLGCLQDRMLYESAALDTAARMVEVGLEKGIFRRTPTGIVYDTGLSEYQHMPLVRHDGFPTENLRLAGIFYDLQEEGRGVEATVHIMGDEWVKLIACRERMLPHFIECPLYASYHKLGCAMVTFHGSKMKSSSGEALLIDELIDRVAALPEVARLSGEGGAGPAPDELARIIILAFYLSRKPPKTIEFSWEQFTDPEHNPGWELASAWSRARKRGSTDLGPDPDPKDADYRYAVLRSQCLRLSVAQSAADYDLLPTMSFLTHLASWYNGTNSNPRVDRVVRTALEVGLAAVGLVDPR